MTTGTPEFLSESFRKNIQEASKKQWKVPQIQLTEPYDIDKLRSLQKLAIENNIPIIAATQQKVDRIYAIGRMFRDKKIFIGTKYKSQEDLLDALDYNFHTTKQEGEDMYKDNEVSRSGLQTRLKGISKRVDELKEEMARREVYKDIASHNRTRIASDPYTCVANRTTIGRANKTIIPFDTCQIYFDIEKKFIYVEGHKMVNRTVTTCFIIFTSKKNHEIRLTLSGEAILNPIDKMNATTAMRTALGNTVNDYKELQEMTWKEFLKHEENYEVSFRNDRKGNKNEQ